MTAKELIQHLSKLPQNSIIKVRDMNEDFNSLNIIDHTIQGRFIYLDSKKGYDLERFKDITQGRSGDIIIHT